MIGTVDTADGLNSKGPPASLVGPALSGPILDLARVEPSTGDEVALLHAYLSHHSPRLLRQMMLVYDMNSQDLYTATLGDDFRGQFAANLIGSERYVGTPGTTAIANAFNAIAGEVCPPGTVNPPTILYAGRQSLLPTLIDQLRGLSMCPRRTITIVTGADAEALPPSATSPNPAGPADLGRLPQPRRPRASHDSVQGGLHRPVRHRRPRRVLGRHDLRRGGCRRAGRPGGCGRNPPRCCPPRRSWAVPCSTSTCRRTRWTALPGTSSSLPTAMSSVRGSRSLSTATERLREFRRRRSLDVRKAQIGPAVLPFSRVMTIRWGQEMRTAADLVTALGRRGG